MPSITPNYLTTSPDGKVSASFTGGLILPTDKNVSTHKLSTTAVQWTKSENGGMFALVNGERVEQDLPTYIHANTLYGSVLSPNGIVSSGLYLTSNDGSGGKVEIQADAPLQSKNPITLLNGAGESAFIQAGGTKLNLGRYLLAWGKVPMNFPGSWASDPTSINHQLGATPEAYTVFPSAPSYNVAANVVVNEINHPDANWIYVRGRTVDGSSVGPGTIDVYWFAITKA